MTDQEKTSQSHRVAQGNSELFGAVSIQHVEGAEGRNPTV